LSLSGHDPTGGAGIQADIEVLFRLGCHACSVVTALTAQDTRDVRRIFPQSSDAFLEQARTVMDDLCPDVIKIGLIGSASLVRAVGEILADVPRIPVVFDPVLAAGGGCEFSGETLVEAIRETVLPRVAVLTPNTLEARRLSGMNSLHDCAARLRDLGCENVLITGTHDDGDDVVNRHYRADSVHLSRWPRLPGVYLGSGCTLAAAIAGFMALGCTVDTAVASAQVETWKALSGAYRLGSGQLLPDRRLIEMSAAAAH
jgi:hydroxymethylpyrimidine/phosphomethylpyrimidine kinase